MENQSLGSIFIDFDNLYAALLNQYKYDGARSLAKTVQIIGSVFGYIEDHLKISPIIRQAFADWSMHQDVLGELYTMGIRAVNIKSMHEKSSADIELSLSLQEIMLTRENVQYLIVVSGDRDYMPISQRVRERGKQIIFFSYKDCLSGDLKKLVGEGNYYYLDYETDTVIEKDEKEQKRGLKEEKGVAKKRRRDKGLELSDDQITSLKAAIRAHKKWSPVYGSTKLGRFLVEDLAIALPKLEHLKRKEVFNTLKAFKLIDVKTESGVGVDFAVFTINMDHPLVKRLSKDL